MFIVLFSSVINMEMWPPLLCRQTGWLALSSGPRHVQWERVTAEAPTRDQSLQQWHLFWTAFGQGAHLLSELSKWLGLLTCQTALRMQPSLSQEGWGPILWLTFNEVMWTAPLVCARKDPKLTFLLKGVKEEKRQHKVQRAKLTEWLPQTENWP